MSAASDVATLAAIIDGERLPSPDEIELIARALGMSASRLASAARTFGAAVEVQRTADSSRRVHRASTNEHGYGLTELVRTSRQPDLRAFLIAPLGDDTPWLTHAQHEYVYNWSDASARIRWSGRDGAEFVDDVLPGGSAYVRPLVRHRFEGAPDASLLVVRVSGLLNDAALDEYALCGSSRSRALHEVERWF